MTVCPILSGWRTSWQRSVPIPPWPECKVARWLKSVPSDRTRSTWRASIPCIKPATSPIGARRCSERAVFDLRFTGYFEDTALGARVLEYGPIGFAEDVRVTHRAVPRRPLNRAHWRILLDDERRLARDYSTFYRRTRGMGFLVTVVVRWLVGSPLKTLVRELPRAGRDPKGYMRLWWLLVRERKDLLAALRDM